MALRPKEFLRLDRLLDLAIDLAAVLALIRLLTGHQIVVPALVTALTLGFQRVSTETWGRSCAARGLASLNRWAGSLTARQGEGIIGGAMALYAVGIGGVSLLKHWGFRTQAFDLGIFDQVVWTSSRDGLLIFRQVAPEPFNPGWLADGEQRERLRALGRPAIHFEGCPGRPRPSEREGGESIPR